ncbi:MAG TPA: hypothetical protein VH254_00945 [Candidatus Udaeobacter sp.]|jgi:hypothetical protein|nr:hypothetical protein [Candidatus Udaeobacter sp.]
MPTPSKYFSKLLLIIGFVCVVSFETASAQPGGRLVIVRAANFGWKIALNVKIDGRTIANVVQGHTFDHLLPPGHHVVTVAVVPNAYFVDPSSVGLNVRPGQLYSFMAMWEGSNRIVLQPTALTPQQLAQVRP